MTRLLLLLVMQERFWLVPRRQILVTSVQKEVLMDQIQTYSIHTTIRKITLSTIAESFAGKVKTSAENSYATTQYVSVAVKYRRTTSGNVQRKSNVLFARVPVIVRRYTQMNNGRRNFVRLQFLKAGSCRIHPSKLFRSVQVCAATPSSRESLVPRLSWCTSTLKTT